MRIVSGLFKGKKILEPKDLKTRPLKDLTKESIFNIIIHSNKFNISLNNANILDVFSGTGSFGLECLSRGSKLVVFIENYKEILPILRKNLNNLKEIKNYRIIENDAFKKFTFSEIENKFDIIFLDPPFKSENLISLFENIQLSKILKENGIIILHRHKNSKANFPSFIKILDEKKYGISRIFFISF